MLVRGREDAWMLCTWFHGCVVYVSGSLDEKAGWEENKWPIDSWSWNFLLFCCEVVPQNDASRIISAVRLVVSPCVVKEQSVTTRIARLGE